MMKILYRLVCSCLLLFTIIKESHSQVIGNGITLQIQKNNQIVGHIIGTMHKFPEGSDVEIQAKLIGLFDESDGLVSELGMAQFVLFQETINNAINTAQNHRNLSTVISNDLLKKIALKLKVRFGNNTMALLEQTHPWAVGNALFSLCPIRANPASIEERLVLLASSKEKNVLALESVSEQVNGLPDFDSKVWSAYLQEIDAFTDKKNCAELYGQIIGDIAKNITLGELNGIEETMNKNYLLLDTRQFDDVFVIGRNQKLTERILKRLESKKRYIFAVGALHLIGPKGIIAALEKNGFKVSEINN
jgi:uncharacterized protein YbaP (TraB family)